MKEKKYRQLTREIKCYGCTVESIEKWLVDVRKTADPLLLATCILSDAQEVLENCNDDRVRQYINKAKFIINKERDKIKLDN